MATEPTTGMAHSQGSGFRSRRLCVFAISYTSFLILIATAAFSLGHWKRQHVERALREKVTRNLTQKARKLASRVNADRAQSIDVIASQEGQAAGARATIIDTNGNVVADSEVPMSSLENEGHL